MPNNSTTDTLKVPSDFRSIRQALKKPFAALSQKPASQSSENLALPILKSGWLFKQGGVVKSWNSRWFVLRGATLFYYANEDETKQLGTINLDGNKIEYQDIAYRKYPFQIIPGGSRSRMTLTHETYQFYASGQEERESWVEAIKKAIECGTSRGGSPALSHKEMPQVPATFGQELADIMEYESKTSNRKVPQILEQCVEYLLKHGLETEGIFRLAGRTLIVKQLKEQFDSGERPEFTMLEMDIHSVASLLKMFLRELPEPLVTVELYDVVITLCTTSMQANPDAAIESLSSILTKLPRHNYNVLQYTCHFLDEVRQLEGINKMSAMNLATIFVGSIIRPNTVVLEELMGTLGARTMVAFLFITKWRELFQMEYNNQGDLVQVDTLIDLGSGLRNVKKFSARTSVHPESINVNARGVSKFFDSDIASDLMQPLMPVATTLATTTEEVEDVVYDIPKPLNLSLNLAEAFDENMNGKTKDEDEVIYDTPEPRPASNSISLPVSPNPDDPLENSFASSDAKSKTMTYSISAENIRRDVQVPGGKQKLEKRLSAPSLRPVVPPRPSKCRHNKNSSETTCSVKPKLMTIHSIRNADNEHSDNSDTTESITEPQSSQLDCIKPASMAENISEAASVTHENNTDLPSGKLDSVNPAVSKSSYADLTDSGHQTSESDSIGDVAQPSKQREKSVVNALCLDILPLSSLSTLGSSNSGSQQSVSSDLQDAKLCEISSSGGSSFSLNDSNQDEVLLNSVKRDESGNESFNMTLSSGNRAAARRSRASVMGNAASQSDKLRISVTSNFSDSSNERLDTDDFLIQELTEKDVDTMTRDALVSHVTTLSTELKIQRKKAKTSNSKLNAIKEKSNEKIQSLAKQLDKEKLATANAVERIVKLQAQLQAYQLKYGELDESVYGNTSFYGLN